MKKILIYIVIVAVIAILCLVSKLSEVKQERDRFKDNQTALLGQVDYYKSESGKNAASVQKLTLTYDELKRSYDGIRKVAEDLSIKLKRAQSVSTTSTKTEVRIKTEVKDSIVYRDKIIPDTLKHFAWSDPWVGVRGTLYKDSVDLHVESNDTLVQIVHKVPHKFWFIKWGCKAIRQDIVTKNPHSKITYTEYIEIK